MLFYLTIFNVNTNEFIYSIFYYTNFSQILKMMDILPHLSTIFITILNIRLKSNHCWHWILKYGENRLLKDFGDKILKNQIIPE